jgi:hypothetical protein
VIDELVTGGWVAESGAGLHLTSEGLARERNLAARVGTIRDRVRDALPGDDYATLVRLLQRLVERFDPAP